MTVPMKIILEDTAPYDESLVRVSAVVPIIIIGPVFLLMAFAEPALTGLALILFILIPIVILTTVYGLGVPGRVTVSEWGIVVRHGVFVRIRVPVEDIVSLSVEPPPWWLNYYYLYANAQWLRVGKRTGILKWWYVPTTSAARLKIAIESIKS